MKTRLIKSEIPALHHTPTHRNRNPAVAYALPCAPCCEVPGCTSHMVMDMRPGTGFFHIPGSVPRFRRAKNISRLRETQTVSKLGLSSFEETTRPRAHGGTGRRGPGLRSARLERTQGTRATAHAAVGTTRGEPHESRAPTHTRHPRKHFMNTQELEAPVHALGARPRGV